MKSPGRKAWRFRVRRARCAAMGTTGVTILMVIFAAAPAGATTSISAPAAANLGSTPTGSSSISAQLGPVTVTTSSIVSLAFTATVSATVFVTGAGGTDETIPKSSIHYWSGPATSTTGTLGLRTPGQATAALAPDLSVTRTAFSGSELLGSTATTWNPTIVVNLPTTAVAGTYSGTITHSVA